MNSKLLNLYYIFFGISIVLFFNTKKYYSIDIYYKAILINLATLFILISSMIQNSIIDKYILPLLLYLNIGILIFMILNSKPTYVRMIPIISIVILLFLFNYKNFEFKYGKLKKPDTKWIYSSILILIIMYLSWNKHLVLIKKKIILILLVLYPLIFPINEYFIHRIVPLSLLLSFNLYRIQ